MQDFEVLLAKSCDDLKNIPTYAKLLPHLRAVERAGVSIVEISGELILKQIGLPPRPWLSRLKRVIRVACLCHDIGKANDGFQKMVRGQISPKLQPARHELLSALLLMEKNSPIQNWVLELLLQEDNKEESEQLLDCVIGAVAGHHLKLDPEWNKASIAIKQGGCGKKIQMLLNHPDLKPLFGKNTIHQEISFSLIDGEITYLGDFRFPFQMNSNQWHNTTKKNRDWWRFAAITKALVAAADVAGSAMLPEKENIKKWVHETLNHRISSEQIREVVNIRLNGKGLRNFQKMVGESKELITLVEAGCGSGKTAAAYLWASYHAHGKKLFFCYPTTGTATEGFLDYVFETEIESKLIHSRSIVDIEGLAEVKNDEEKNDHLLRIISLNAWSPQVVVCTIDTVLALVCNNRRGLYNSPSILSSAFVFDELHAYDNKMFESVVAFIKALPGASFLLMTASLPKNRRDFLIKHLENVYEIPPSRELEKIPRYIFNQLTQEEAFEKSKKAIESNKRVLWICNTVARAQCVFYQLNEEHIPSLTYHSRFKYKDRKIQHRKIISNFNNETQKTGIVAVTTQVAEMSLDLDADILITEIAPIPSLIQRLGRLNRRVTIENKGEPRHAYFLEPDKSLPYRREELTLSQQWLKELIEIQHPLSQSDLSEYFDKLSIQEELKLDTRTAWLDSGWFAIPDGIREPSYSIQIIMEEDEQNCQYDTKELIKCTIPMNYNATKMSHWREFKGYLIAPKNAIQYDQTIGATLL